MDSFGLPGSPLCDVQTFIGTNLTVGGGWQTWRKPLGKSMCNIFLVGSGGNGGNGVVGANSTAGGGAGGGSGGQTIMTIPFAFLPDVLYLNLLGGGPGASGTFPSRITVYPYAGTDNFTVTLANNGGNGGNASGGSGGSAGSNAGSVSIASQQYIGFSFLVSAIAGQVGTNGGAAVSGTGSTIPTTGIRVMGGTGGGGLPAAAATGTNGGSIGGLVSPFPLQPGGQGSATATAPAANGNAGYIYTASGMLLLGGTGAASTHGTATGGGLVGGNGGDGGPGCGGGGGGGALTGSTQGLGGKGGPAMAIITCW